MSLTNDLRLYTHLIAYKLTNPNSRNYRAQWDNFWSSVRRTGPGGGVLWDSLPGRASQDDVTRFRPYLAPDLPLIDVGCGNGRQTRFLAQQFDRVIGVDVSPAAVDLARRENASCAANVEFRVLDLTQPEQARALHAEVGDANVYMRGVLHAIQRADRPAVVTSLRCLLGAAGILYQIELSAAALRYFRQLPGDSPSGLPRLLHAVVRRGIQPVGFSLTEQPRYYPNRDWQVLAAGEEVTITTVPLGHGEEGHVPANFLILRPVSRDL